ncbi:MAG TPA: hypothetical protein VF472_12000 [Burkholderiaceae bacterium]
MKSSSIRHVATGIMLAACAAHPLAALAQVHGGSHIPAPTHPGTHGGNVRPDRSHPHGDGRNWHGDGRHWHGDGLDWWSFGLGLGLGWGVPYYNYPYPSTTYIYPVLPEVVEIAPPVAVAPAPPATQQSQAYWYYCASAKAYYPYVRECPEAWQVVPAAPPGPSQ